MSELLNELLLLEDKWSFLPMVMEEISWHIDLVYLSLQIYGNQNWHNEGKTLHTYSCSSLETQQWSNYSGYFFNPIHLVNSILCLCHDISRSIRYSMFDEFDSPRALSNPTDISWEVTCSVYVLAGEIILKQNLKSVWSASTFIVEVSKFTVWCATDLSSCPPLWWWVESNRLNRPWPFSEEPFFCGEVWFPGWNINSQKLSNQRTAVKIII